jgi:universal stress protein A
MLRPTKILVPTDFSEYSDRALKQALNIAKQYKAEVFLLHAVSEDAYPTNLDSAPPEVVVRRIKDGTVVSAQETLQKQLDSFPQHEGVNVVTNIRHGVPYEEILKEAEEKEIDLIVIASLGRSGIAKYLIGGVARNVLKGAKCPVLLTK